MAMNESALFADENGDIGSPMSVGGFGFCEACALNAEAKITAICLGRCGF
jgi:hypothetical protein